MFANKQNRQDAKDEDSHPVSMLKTEENTQWWRHYLSNQPEVVTLSGKLATLGNTAPAILVNGDLETRALQPVLEHLSSHRGTALNCALTAALALYLYRYTGQSSFTVGIFGTAEPAGSPDLSKAGMCPWMPLRIQLTPGLTIRELAKKVSDGYQDLLSHRHYPADELGETTAIRSYATFVEEERFKVESNSMKTEAMTESLPDISVALVVNEGSLVGRLTIAANSAHYDCAGLKLHLDRLQSVFKYFEPERLESLCSDVELLSAAERQLVLHDWNATAYSVDESRLVHELFEVQAESYPQQRALSSGDESLTYSQLNGSANQIARHLRSLGVGPGTRVAICVERGIGMIRGLLAIMKAGGTYVPIDPSFPSERIAEMLRDSHSKLLLNEPATNSPLAELATHIPRIDLQNDGSRWADEREDNLGRLEGDGLDRLVYIIYTSGSTGLPKGVGITQRNLLNYSSYLVGRLPQFQHMKFGSVSTIAADLGNTVVFPSLISGGDLHILGYETATNANLFEKYMLEHELDVIKITPSHYRALFEAKPSKAIVPAKALVFGGERLTSELVASIRRIRPECRVYNHYGPTECTVGAIMTPVEDVQRSDVSIPLGRPIGNARVYVLNSDFLPVPVGAIGEICIGGAGVAPGYINRPELTAERFLDDPFSGNANAKMYRTGDLGRWLSDGMIEFLGRNDFQVKIRGFRIELGEIEAALAGHDEVRECALLAQEENGGKRLVAFYVSEGPLDRESLHKHLVETLPEYMVPALFVRIPAIPLTPNGKVDRQALSRLVPTKGTSSQRSLRDSAEIDARFRPVIANLEDVLEVSINSLDVSFVGLGGDSLSYIRISVIIEDVLGTLPLNWESLTLRQLEALLPDPSTSANAKFLVPIELSVLLRCFSICMVVVNHAVVNDLFIVTSTLFVVSGVNFARFLVPTIVRTGSLKSVGRFVLKLAIPSGLWQFMRFFWGHFFWLPNLFLMGTFFQQPGHPRFTLWYLEVLAANLLLLGGAARLAASRLKARQHGQPHLLTTYSYAVMLVLLGLVMACVQVLSGVWDGVVGTDSVAPFKWFWLLAMGWMVAESTTPKRRVISSLLVVAIGAAAYGWELLRPVLDEARDPFFLGSTVLFIWKTHVRIPRILHKAVVLVASATLFIYITNYASLTALAPRLGLSGNLPASIGFALVVGVVSSMMWTWVSDKAGPLWNRLVHRAQPEQPV